MYRSIPKRSSVAVTLFAAAALIPVLCYGTVQSAATPSMSETVKYADLDLTRSADAKVLIERIRVAAHNVCAPNQDDAARHACYKQAVRGAVKQVNQPLLTASL